MFNYSIRNASRLNAVLVAAFLFAGVLAARAQVSNELRFTSISTSSGQHIAVSIAGLGSAASNGCGFVSLGFVDGIGGNSLWPSPGMPIAWRTDFAEVAMHRFDVSRNYQRFAGVHFYRAIATTNPVPLAPDGDLPVFDLGDDSGYTLVTNLTAEEGRRVYSDGLRDGTFLYADLYKPHWIVWSTNGTRWVSGWPFVNAPIAGDTHVWTGVPNRWAVAVRGSSPVAADGFCRVPGIYGELDDFYIAQTECTEASAAAVVAYGVSNGLCSASAFPSMPGRGTNCPVTGWPLAHALALCNLATRCHAEMTGEPLEAVYLTNGAAFYSPITNIALIARSEGARGYRLPTVAEYRVAAAGDTRSRYPWGNGVSDEYYYATNGLPVTELTIIDAEEAYYFYRKYHLLTTNSVGNYMSRNGGRHLSPGRVGAVRAQYKSWRVPAVNTNGSPVVFDMGAMKLPMFFGDTINDAGWGSGVERVHDLAGNVSEYAWPPVARPWGGAPRVAVCGGASALDAAAAVSGRSLTVSADVGRSTVGFRFARNRFISGE